MNKQPAIRRPISKPQRDAMYAVEAAGDTGLTPASKYSIATMNVLRTNGWITIAGGRYNWIARLTPNGQGWCNRNRMTPEQETAAVKAEANRAEYRSRAAKYIENVCAVFANSNDPVEKRAAKILATVKRPGMFPARVEDVGWHITDNIKDGAINAIGTALCRIGECCNHRGYPITERDMESLSDWEQDLNDYMNEIGL